MNTEYQLFRLFHTERNIKDLEDTFSLNISKLEQLQSEKEKAEKRLKEAKKLSGVQSRELAKLEIGINDHVSICALAKI